MKSIYDWHKKVYTTKLDKKHPICPFAAKAKFKISTESVYHELRNWDDTYDLVIVDHQQYMTVEFAEQMEDTYCKVRNDVVVLLEHFENPGFINAVFTGCGDKKILFLLQNKSKLEEAKMILQKSNYYENYPQEYLEKLWKNR